MVWYSPVFIMGGRYWAWIWQLRASASHRRSMCASPAMHASQGDSLGIFQGSFWLVLIFLGRVQQELLCV